MKGYMNLKSNQFSIALFLIGLLIAMPMAGFAQGQKPSKSRKNPAGKPQSPPPESVKPDADQKPEQNEARRPGEEKPDDENKPGDRRHGVTRLVLVIGFFFARPPG